MKARTFMSTDWIEVHDHGSVYEAKVLLTDEDRTYMIIRQDNKKQFFRVDAKLLKVDELGFFEKVMESAKELSVKETTELGFFIND